MPTYPVLSDEDRHLLVGVDTPTVCNVIELFDVRPRNSGFMDRRIKDAFRSPADGRLRVDGDLPVELLRLGRAMSMPRSTRRSRGLMKFPARRWLFFSRSG